MSGDSVSEPLLPLTEVDFCAWVGRAEPGDILEYYRGHLSQQAKVGPRPSPGRKALRRLARRAVWASDVGLVHLVQRRIGPGDFSYLAVRRPRPRQIRATTCGPVRLADDLESELEDAA